MAPYSTQACEWVGYPNVTRSGQFQAVVAKSKQTCSTTYNLKASGGRLNFNRIEVSDAKSDGTVIVEIKKNGDNDYTLIFTPQVAGEHEVSYSMLQSETNGRTYVMRYVLELNVDMKYKDPGSLD